MRCLALILLALAGCKTCPVQPPPEVVYVTVEKVAPVPTELSKPCNIPAKQSNSVEEAVRLANERLAALQECDQRMGKIRKLPGTTP